MTPEELTQKLKELEEKINRIDQGFRNASQIDPQYVDVISSIIKIEMNDLQDVNDTGITNGQLLKWNSTSGKYEPANDIDT